MESGDHELVELARRLVRVPSVLGGEEQVSELVLDEMKARGFERVRRDAAGNILGVIRGLKPGRSVLFDAHMDTVDVLPREEWRFDPFGADLRDGKIFGRGSSDMKGALACMIHGLARLNRSRIRGEAVLCASVGEESTEGTALKGVFREFTPDYVVIGEATNQRIARAGRGRAEFKIETRGRAAHASTPHLGENAVHLMNSLISEFEELPMPNHGFVGSGVMCLTDIISKPFPAHSVVPSGCRVTYERRLIPGEELEVVRSELERCCQRAGCGDATIELAEASYLTYTGMNLVEKKWYPPWELPESHPLVQMSIKGLTRVGFRPELSAYQFCTNASYSAGVKGVPTIGYGPSSESLAHIVDEYVEVEDLKQACRGYSGIAEELLS